MDMLDRNMMIQAASEAQRKKYMEAIQELIKVSIPNVSNAWQAGHVAGLIDAIGLIEKETNNG